MERGGLPGGRHLPQRLGRDREAVAHAAAGDHDVVGAPDGDLAREQGDHRRPVLVRRPPTVSRWGCARARRMGAELAWQMATARASAAWSGRGSSSRARRVWTIRWTWSLAARPEPHTAPLICCGV